MFKFLFKRRDEDVHAAELYTKLLTQSRNPAFYGEGRVTDNYDGRIDMLSLHQALVMQKLQKHGEEGKVLSQALYDVMIDDFNIAMREEGLADTGISRRIKPMVQLFFDRLTSLTQALNDGEGVDTVLSETILREAVQSGFVEPLSGYVLEAATAINGLSLEDIQHGKIEFPAL